MKKGNLIISICLLMIITISLISTCLYKNKEPANINTIEGTIIASTDSTVTIKDSNNGIYTFKIDDLNIDNGEKIVIEYTGLLNQNNEMQDVSIINYSLRSIDNNDNNDNNDNGIFSKFYTLANIKLKELSLDEKIGQIFLLRYPDNNANEVLEKYNPAGFVFYTKDFKDKTKDEVKNMINNLQKNSKIPLLTAVDEEGGSVIRISSNPNLVDSPFKSPQALYNIGGFDEIHDDTIYKSQVLSNLGLNVNLAPVVDVSTNPSDYMYNRTLGKDTDLTSEYAKTVIEASKNNKVSYVLKHFPGYGNNNDTHSSSVIDNRDRDDIFQNDIPPFIAGITSGAEAVLVSHNIVSNIDNINPASLSTNIHNILRNDLNFTGIIMTDDLEMGALTGISTPAVQALIAGNDLIIVTDYQTNINEVKNAIKDGTITEELINEAALRVLAWKYYKGLMYDNDK